MASEIRSSPRINAGADRPLPMEPWRAPPNFRADTMSSLDSARKPPPGRVVWCIASCYIFVANIINKIKDTTVAFFKGAYEVVKYLICCCRDEDTEVYSSLILDALQEDMRILSNICAEENYPYKLLISIKIEAEGGLAHHVRTNNMVRARDSNQILPVLRAARNDAMDFTIGKTIKKVETHFFLIDKASNGLFNAFQIDREMAPGRNTPGRTDLQGASLEGIRNHHHQFLSAYFPAFDSIIDANGNFRD